jgi:hypothetical protein
MNIVIQINGKVRKIWQTKKDSKENLIENAKREVSIETYHDVIFVPGKVINFVC